MSYTERVNRYVLDFFLKATDLIIQIRNNGMNYARMNHQQDQQLNSRFKMEEEKKADHKFNLIHNPNNIFIDEILDENPTWLMPDQKQIIIEFYLYNSNQKPCKVEEWKFTFIHKDQDILFEKQKTIIRDPNLFNLQLSILMRSISQLLFQLPLFQWQLDQQQIRFNQGASDTNNHIQQQQQQTSQQQTQQIYKTKSDTKLLKKIYFNEQFAAALGQGKKGKFKKEVELLHHNFIFEVTFIKENLEQNLTNQNLQIIPESEELKENDENNLSNVMEQLSYSSEYNQSRDEMDQYEDNRNIYDDRIQQQDINDIETNVNNNYNQMKQIQKQCGEGNFTKNLDPFFLQGNQLTGNDISTATIRKCSENLERNQSELEDNSQQQQQQETLEKTASPLIKRQKLILQQNNANLEKIEEFQQQLLQIPDPFQNKIHSILKILKPKKTAYQNN